MSGKKRDTSVVEFSITSIILGVLLAVLFGGANAYLGLRVGMTVSASIPAAVISMGIIRVLLRKDSILESNMVQTIGSAGESVAAGAIFTLPVLFMWAEEGISGFPGYMEITAICICASILGILFMVPLRNALIVKEHMTLPYPEGTACAKVLVAGKEKKSEASWVFIGLVIAGIYKFIVDGVRLFGSQIHYEFKKLKGAGIGVDVLPALISVGYICGFRIASFMLAGGIISWLALMPVISMFGNDIVLFPGDVLIGSMTSNQLWSNYIRYIGAGAVAAAGIISLVKSLPMLCNAFVSSFSKENRKFQAEGGRSERNIPMKWIIILVWMVGLGTLLAGAIGVSNIMMVTVKERTTEIGIRRAIGARPKDILNQILSESMVLTTFAGLLGICFGVLVLQGLEIGTAASGTEAHFQISFWMAVGACILLMVLGMLAGLAPAYRAMAIKPIEAIRDE